MEAVGTRTSPAGASAGHAIVAGHPEGARDAVASLLAGAGYERAHGFVNAMGRLRPFDQFLVEGLEDLRRRVEADGAAHRSLEAAVASARAYRRLSQERRRQELEQLVAALECLKVRLSSSGALPTSELWKPDQVLADDAVTSMVPFVLDIETSGMRAGKDCVSELAVLCTATGREFQTLAYERMIDFMREHVHAGGPGCVPLLIGHNILRFDLPMIQGQAAALGLPPLRAVRALDTLLLARGLQSRHAFPALRLGALYAHFTGRGLEGAHRAMADVRANAAVLEGLLACVGARAESLLGPPGAAGAGLPAGSVVAPEARRAAARARAAAPQTPAGDPASPLPRHKFRPAEFGADIQVEHTLDRLCRGAEGSAQSLPLERPHAEERVRLWRQAEEAVRARAGPASFLDTPLSDFRRPHAFTALQLAGMRQADIRTLRDLLHSFPRSYSVFPFGALPRREVWGPQPVCLVAELEHVASRPVSRGGGWLEARYLVVDPAEGAGAAGDLSAAGSQPTRLTLRKFRGAGNPPLLVEYWALKKQVRQRFVVSGRVEPEPGGGPGDWVFAGADYRAAPAADADVRALRSAGALVVPDYGTRAGLSSARLAAAVGKGVALLRGAAGAWDDPVPARVRERAGLGGYLEALEAAHAPRNAAHFAAGRLRLSFQEVFELQVRLLARQRARRDRDLAGGVRAAPALDAAGLGDVGTGKTAVALLAALQALGSGLQVAIMAPTEILAAQLAAVFRERGAARQETLRGLADGSISVAVGTHALLGERTRFARLGLVIVDEEHRFGVAQRAALAGKAAGTAPHVLGMSATPIPRTQALLAHGELTHVVGNTPASDVPAATAERARALRRPWAWTRSRVGLLHGRLAPEAKAAALAAFAAGRTPVLVTTSVVEVGVDVPAASLMIVERAERFGLGAAAPAARPRGPRRPRGRLLPGRRRRRRGEAARAGARARDGFEVAELDFALRGAGDVLGTRQSGRRAETTTISGWSAASGASNYTSAAPSLGFFCLPRDQALVEPARAGALDFLEACPAPADWPRELLGPALEWLAEGERGQVSDEGGAGGEASDDDAATGRTKD
ncbi:hypothetical protein QBZ16_003805 [Prototheca wickerhamii]|uniref:Helicase ATP-binding domain-containing protein n=1 Tax=Prototheca wickerhamii TaxID=3111 RepID=A0AAD9IL24_PROWI|nr:hypothetical protein QBZ16_003805 [Prototheca wickerhamii]